jgi:hypothetical protein
MSSLYSVYSVYSVVPLWQPLHLPRTIERLFEFSPPLACPPENAIMEEVGS